MNRSVIRFFAFILTALILLPSCMAGCARQATDADTVTVIFTHDMHSQYLAQKTESGILGGYAEMMTLIKEQKKLHPDAILVDGGDFSMGSLFQTAYATEATELRLMGAMGYDAVTLGNHEFDYKQEGFASMLNAALDSGDPLPPIVEANYTPEKKGESGYNADMVSAVERYGVQDYIILERGGSYFVIFGILGINADNCAPNSGMELEDPIATAQRTVDKATEECLEKYGADPFVVCLSHGGTQKRKGEDYDLAEGTDGIDLIVSGHSHSMLEEPITVNGTVIASAGEYGRYLGVATFLRRDGGNSSLCDYQLIPVDSTVKADPEIAALIEDYKISVEENYLSYYGTDFDEVVVHNDVCFESLKTVKASRHESTLCNLYTDAYKAAAEEALGRSVDLAFTMAGTIRETVPCGDITTYDIFCTSPLGVGSEGIMVCVYLTGEDLRNALEIDASVQPDIKAAQMYFSGLEYSYNRTRVKYNRVHDFHLIRDDGTTEKIENDELYSVVCGIYSVQLLNYAEEYTNGVLNVTFRDEKGDPLTAKTIRDLVIRDENGEPLAEWYALYSYLKGMGGEMSEKYLLPDSRKNVYSSLAPNELLSHPNKYTYTALITVNLIAVLTVGAAVVAVRLTLRLIGRKTKKQPRK